MVSVRKSILLFAAPIALAAYAAQAEEPDEHDHRAHDVHVHGTWEMFAALDDAQLSVTLKGPLVDVLGFERAPKTDEERTSVARLKEQLKAPELMLATDERARCTLSAPEAVLLPEDFSPEITKASDDHEDDHDDHHHDEDHHDADHHDEDHHDDGHHHDDHEDHADHDGDGNHADHDVHKNDLEVTYVFDCASPGRLRSITMTGFDEFPAIENVEAVFLSGATQSAGRLTRESQTLTID